jgi:hypothetical protein
LFDRLRDSKTLVPKAFQFLTIIGVHQKDDFCLLSIVAVSRQVDRKPTVKTISDFFSILHILGGIRNWFVTRIALIFLEYFR